MHQVGENHFIHIFEDNKSSAAIHSPCEAELGIARRNQVFNLTRRSPATVVKRKATGASALGAGAIGAIALGAFAVGAIAVGSLAIGRIVLGSARIKRMQIDELIVGKLTIRER
jgi:hypothetical protein